MTYMAACDQLSSPRLENTDAEQMLLGALLADNSLWPKVAPLLRPEHFAIPLHGEVYRQISTACMSGAPANASLLAPLFADDTTYQDINNGAELEYLADLQRSALPVVAPEAYARRLVEMAQRRGLEAAAKDFTAGAHNLDVPIAEALTAAQNRLANIWGDKTEGRPVALKDVLRRVTLGLEKDDEPGLPTGFAALDRAFRGGLKPKRLYVIAGRPGMGKSALAVNLALNMSRSGAKGLFLSHEMAAEEIGERIIARRAKVPQDHLDKARISKEEHQAALQAEHDLRDVPLFIEDTAGRTVEDVIALATLHQQTIGLDYVVLDHLGLLDATDPRANKVHQIEHQTKNLKRLTKQLAAPVILLSQLSRAVEQREDKRPTMADLRDSGTIEQDADAILLLYRAEYYVQKQRPQQRQDEGGDAFTRRENEWQAHLANVANLLDLGLAKNRQGKAGFDITLRCDMARGDITDLDQRSFV